MNQPAPPIPAARTGESEGRAMSAEVNSSGNASRTEYVRLFQRYLAVWVALFAGLAVSGVTARLLYQRAKRVDEERFRQYVSIAKDQIETVIEKHEHGLGVLQNWFTVTLNPELTGGALIPDQLHRSRLVDLDLPVNFRGVYEVGYAERGPRYRFKVTQIIGHSPGPFLKTNDSLLETPTMSYVGEAIRSGAPRGATLVELGRGPDGRIWKGVRLCFPVYGGAERSSGPPSGSPVTTQEWRTGLRQIDPLGVVFAAFDLNEIIRALAKDLPREIAFELFASKEPRADSWLNEDQARERERLEVNGKTPPNLPRALDASFQPYLKMKFDFPSYAERWCLFAWPTPAFFNHSTRSFPWLALGGGGAITLLVAAALALQIRARLRQEAIAGALRAATDALLVARHERGQLSRDLHDGAIQSLYATRLALGQSRKRLPGTMGKVADGLGQCEATLDSTIQELRAFIQNQEARTEPAPPPSGALRSLLEQFQRINTAELRVQIDDPALDALDPEPASQLLRIIREAVSNSLRHAEARTVTVEVARADARLRLEVRDDGRGFDPAHTRAQGQGLGNMRRRAVELGSVFKIESVPGQGTRVCLEMPMNARPVVPVTEVPDCSPNKK